MNTSAYIAIGASTLVAASLFTYYVLRKSTETTETPHSDISFYNSKTGVYNNPYPNTSNYDANKYEPSGGKRNSKRKKITRTFSKKNKH